MLSIIKLINDRNISHTPGTYPDNKTLKPKNLALTVSRKSCLWPRLAGDLKYEMLSWISTIGGELRLLLSSSTESSLWCST